MPAHLHAGAGEVTKEEQEAQEAQEEQEAAHRAGRVAGQPAIDARGVVRVAATATMYGALPSETTQLVVWLATSVLTGASVRRTGARRQIAHSRKGRGKWCTRTAPDARRRT
eukprot:SAG31_NODE_526_length_14475_cov_5.135197_7_plen_112_part_00